MSTPSSWSNRCTQGRQPSLAARKSQYCGRWHLRLLGRCDTPGMHAMAAHKQRGWANKPYRRSQSAGQAFAEQKWLGSRATLLRRLLWCEDGVWVSARRQKARRDLSLLSSDSVFLLEISVIQLFFLWLSGEIFPLIVFLMTFSLVRGLSFDCVSCHLPFFLDLCPMIADILPQLRLGFLGRHRGGAGQAFAGPGMAKNEPHCFGDIFFYLRPGEAFVL